MKKFASILLVGMAMFISGCAAMQPMDTASALKKISNSNIENKAYAKEDKNWNLDQVSEYKSVNYHSPTPISHPNSKVITTYELCKMVASADDPTIIDVQGGKHKTADSIPGAVWLKGFGSGPKALDGIDLQRFSKSLAKITNNEKNTPLVFSCLDSRCWLSYNAIFRAAELGYTNLYWYRGGITSWKSARLPFVSIGIYDN